ncbi:MAG TPA: PAS domain-containing sensor histidine kinase [Candidatus Sulfotelmatobacter sp.]|nr:PAS domain-containing sensor histidine kinase [Candidatus Sulfotelmatobacter sp.]
MASRFLFLNPQMVPALTTWARGVGLGRKLALGLTVAAVLSVLATYGAITGIPPFGPDPATVLWLLDLNLVLVLALGVVIARRVVEVWAERRRGLAGSRLHVRLVVLFAVVAVTPAIVVAIFSALFLNRGLQGWFNERISAAVSNSAAVAEAYLHEHQQAIRADILVVAAALNRDGSLLLGDPDRLSRELQEQVENRSLSEAVVFDGTGRVLARAGLTFSIESAPIPPEIVRQANNGEVAILTSQGDDRVRALVRLDSFMNVYLYVGRFVEPLVLNYVEETRRIAATYSRLEGQRSGLQVTFALIFVVVALLLLLAAVWVGLVIATKLARPISLLIAASERVRAGDLTARVEEPPALDELGSLSRAFNRMTSQLAAQRAELVEANRQLDLRRRFTETVLSGVSAGVIGLDATGRINLPNRSASDLLSSDLQRHVGEPLADVVPEMAELVETALRRPERLIEAQIKLARDRRTRTLLTRVAVEQVGGELRGFVVTFDDITELLSAQRKAAWADVARRIAHEIKNPLTPIQLSAERLKRKYLKEITSDPETFAICTDTIVRQVGDIGRMVDEFSAFARMPAPVMKTEDLVALCREVAFLHRQPHRDIAVTLDCPDQPLYLRCDGRLIRQALINLAQNAVDAIEGREKPDGAPLPRGEVTIRLRETERTTIIEVDDNGRGLPADGRDRLTEPYVTTRTKGTGLGLAIVKKIMEDHGGELRLEDAPGGGARVSLVFARGVKEAAPERAETHPRSLAHGA